MMKILSDNISTELRFQGDIAEMKEIIRKLTSEEREVRNKSAADLKKVMKEFLKNAFGTADESKLDDTRAIFTQLDIYDILDDFTDYAAGVPWNELAEKNKKRRLARIAQNPRRDIY